jgi:uncharacterized membrane protein
MLEDRVQGLEREISGLKERLVRIEGEQGRTYAPPRPAPRPQPGVAATPRPAPQPAQAPKPAPWESVDFEDLLGGRVLAWLGGVAVAIGLAFLMALAISSGWIGEGARTVIGGGAAAALIAVGIWLHERRGRTDAALAALSAGIASMFAVAAVATTVYGLVPDPVGLLIATGTGALATWLAVRWESQGIAALGLLGAMLAPALGGGFGEGPAVAVLFVAASGAVAVLVSQGWRWLSFGVVLVALPQWVGFLIDNHDVTVEVVAVLMGFGVLGAVAAIGHELRARAERLSASAAFLLMVNAPCLGGAGWFALEAAAGRPAAIAWIWALAAAHAGVALWASRREELPHDLSLLLFGAGTVIADVAFATTFDGPVRTVGWVVTGVAFAALARHQRNTDTETNHDGAMVSLGLGGHLALALAQAVMSDASPAMIGNEAGPSLAAGAALVALAAGCFASGRLADGAHGWLRGSLDAVGLAVLGFLTVITLDGLPLVLALAAEAVALAGLARREHDDVAAWGALSALALAFGFALEIAPPSALGLGLDQPLTAAAALAALVAATGSVAFLAPASGMRSWLTGAAALLVLYLASVLVVTPFQPDGAAAQAAVLELPVRQQGQVLLSGLWALVGLSGLVVGLFRDLRPVRLAALGLLLVAVAKVFTFDLATLASVYRVASFVALGVLLLVAAFVWQRVRPRALPDMREAPAGIR